MQVCMSTLAEQRLADYLRFKGLDVSGDLSTVDLNELGFDATDWGILIGEIQCDTLMMLDWYVPVTEFTCLDDLMAALKNNDCFDEIWQIHTAMDSLWSAAERAHWARRSEALSWPS
jgi:hypothetical protein